VGNLKSQDSWRSCNSPSLAIFWQPTLATIRTAPPCHLSQEACGTNTWSALLDGREVVSLVNGMVAEMANLQYALQSMRFVGDLLSTSGNPLLVQRLCFLCSLSQKIKLSQHCYLQGLLQEIASYLAQCQQYYEALGLTQQKPPFSMSV